MTAATPDDNVRRLEECAFNAWPALSTVLVDGWILRFAAGYTKRANSLNAWAPTTSIDAILPHAQVAYARAGLPLVVRLSPLAGSEADAALAGLGYRLLDETVVMTVSLRGQFRGDAAVAAAASPESRWSQGFAAANQVPELHRRTHDSMLSAIPWPAAFASLDQDGRSLGWGLAVAERGMVGLFDIVTASDVRRQGVGRRLVTSLLTWGQAIGAGEAYLQVIAANAPAIALYRELGFRETYRYHYRVAPDRATP